MDYWTNCRATTLVEIRPKLKSSHLPKTEPLLYWRYIWQLEYPNSLELRYIVSNNYLLFSVTTYVQWWMKNANEKHLLHLLSSTMKRAIEASINYRSFQITPKQKQEWLEINKTLDKNKKVIGNSEIIKTRKKGYQWKLKKFLYCTKCFYCEVTRQQYILII